MFPYYEPVGLILCLAVGYCSPFGVKRHPPQSCVWSLHPQRMISPLFVISHPVLWKNDSHPASAKTATESKLCVISGVWCAVHAWRSNLFGYNNMFSVVAILVPFGCMTCFLGVWSGSVAAGVLVSTSNIFATVSPDAVVCKCVGLVQPRSVAATLIKLFRFNTWLSLAFPVGTPCCFGFQYICSHHFLPLDSSM